jgi:hypothetical protein
MKKTTKQILFSCVAGSVLASAALAADNIRVAVAPAAPPAPVSKTLWSYQPVQRPAEPWVKDKRWVRRPIDAFILSKLEAEKIKPSPDADRATFIRRATLDVWGMIPTVDEVKAFEDDRSPDAYEKLVDRLLASPHYGEREARRWLDLARYSDSTGFQNDQTRPNMWRYRDYVINAFNHDKPYDRFVKEQLAGDEIAPDSPDALIATDFLAGYPDNYNSRDLVDRKYQITTDITDTVGQVFLAQTVGCARCHDHKFDKTTQKDYYSLQSFFANLSEVNDIPAPKGEIETKYQEAQAKYREATKDIRAKQKAIIDSVRDAAIKFQKERYLTDSREAVFKPESEWTALDRWVNHRWKNVTQDQELSGYLQDSADKGSPNYDPERAAKWEEYKKLGEELKKYAYLKPESGSDKITAMNELGHTDAPPTYVLFGGNHERPLDEVQPAFPAAIANGETPHIVPTATSSGRRTALANWIASAKNPLTARVYVNRVWYQYFGHGIVETVSDFGKAGQKPTNPELLDYLADKFANEDGWSIKQLHREILLSSVYRQSSAYRADAYKVDPENKLLAVFPRRRLDAEQIRDSLLLAAGELNDKVGGPSVLPPLPQGLAGGKDFYENALWTVSKEKSDWNRRSLYIFTRRSLVYPMLASFDMSSPQQVHSKRDVTTTPLQALTLYNSEVVFEWSQALAGRVIREAGNDESKQLDRLYLILFARYPDRTEKKDLRAFLDSHEKVIRGKAVDGKFDIAVPTGLKDPQNLDPLRAAAFVDLVHTVANSNDFTYRF